MEVLDNWLFWHCRTSCLSECHSLIHPPFRTHVYVCLLLHRVLLVSPPKIGVECAHYDYSKQTLSSILYNVCKKCWKNWFKIYWQYHRWLLERYYSNTVKSGFNEWPPSALFHSLNWDFMLNRDFLNWNFILVARFHSLNRDFMLNQDSLNRTSTVFECHSLIHPPIRIHVYICLLLRRVRLVSPPRKEEKLGLNVLITLTTSRHLVPFCTLYAKNVEKIDFEIHCQYHRWLLGRYFDG